MGWTNPENTCNKLIEHFNETGFCLVPEIHSIHHEQSIKFMTNIIKAEGWVLNILTSGVRLDFNTVIPASYIEPNNKSAIKEMSFLQEKIAEWVRAGFVSELSNKPKFVNPLSVVVKTDHASETVKKRPVIDLSRCVNKLLQTHHFTMDTLTNCESSVCSQDFQLVFDLENMYFHFKLHPDHRKYFAFALPDSQDILRYYQFNVMCYGYSLAGYIVTRVIAPIKAFLHRLGIRISIYIDDGRVLAKTFAECLYKTKFTLLVFQLCGFNIQWKKTMTEPAHTALYQGFVTDTINMRYYVQPEKFSLILALVEETLFKLDHNTAFKIRDLATVLGKIHSLRRSHGTIVSVMTRQIQHTVGKEVFRAGWDSSVILDQHCREELVFLKEHLVKFNGKLIPVSRTGAKTVLHQEVCSFIKEVCYSDTLLPNLFISDSSDSTAFIFFKDKFVQSQDFELDEKERNVSSGHRELLATLKFLEHCKSQKVKFSSPIIYWQTDSKNTFIFLSKGSRQPSIQQDIVKIKFLEQELNITIIPVWTPRTHTRIILADLGSKFSQSTDEWGVNRDQLQGIFHQLNIYPTIDCFASTPSAICDLFYSKIPQNGCAGINFYVQELVSTHVYFCCPPTKEIVYTFKHLISSTNIKAILIIPAWFSASFWPVLHDGCKFRKEISNYLFFSPEFLVFNQTNSLFSRKPNFQMLALVLSTGCTNQEKS